MRDKRPSRGISDRRYRYIRYHDGFEELYGLQSDPHEFRILAKRAVYAQVLQRVSARLPDEAADSAGPVVDSPYHRPRN